MQNQLQPNDIPLLAKIFSPSTEKIFVLTSTDATEYYQKINTKLDCTLQFFSELTVLQKILSSQKNAKIVLFNLQTKHGIIALIEQFPKLIIIDFNRSVTLRFATALEFDFINNRDNTIRWIYDTNHQKPIFLNLYNASGWKGQLFKTALKIAFGLKAKNWLKSGSFRVIANQLFFEQIKLELNQATYAIFTGTVGANRKAVITYEEHGKATQFLKMPLTKKVQHLVDREAFYLKELQKYNFEKLIIPAAKKTGNSVMVSNVKPDKCLINNELSNVHLAALNELYQQTTERILVQTTEVWQTIHQDLTNIATGKIWNDLPKEKIERLSIKLKVLAQYFGEITTLPMSIAHGDLTPWNSYLSKEKLHVYDWELADRLPILYDAFHYILQTSILVEKLPFSAIQLKLNNLANRPIIKSLLAKFGITFQDAYRFYLLRNTSYYLSRYIQQKDLHVQAHWLVDRWEVALADTCGAIAVSP